MPTLFAADARAELKRRLASLTPEARAQWGRMNAPQMVCHVADQLRVALGEVTTRPRLNFLRFQPFRQLFVHWLPWPKGKVPTVPEMQSSPPGDWDADRAAVADLIDRFATRVPGGAWAPHPGFGKVSGREWGAICAKHLDHHFRQFGV
jgi:hypothetical protein